MNREHEYKSFSIALKAEEVESDGRNFKAVLSTYKNEDYVGDIIEPGAFDDFLASESELVMLSEHNIQDIIGRWTNMKVVGNQFRAEGEIMDKGEVQIADETAARIKAKLIKGVSIAFPYSTAEYTRREDEEPDAPYYSFRFTKVYPYEASIVLRPANDKAGLKSADIAKVNEARWNRLNNNFELFQKNGDWNKRGIERILTQGGLTRSQSKEIILALRDSANKQQIDMNDSIDLVEAWAEYVLNN